MNNIRLAIFSIFVLSYLIYITRNCTFNKINITIKVIVLKHWTILFMQYHCNSKYFIIMSMWIVGLHSFSICIKVDNLIFSAKLKLSFFANQIWLMSLWYLLSHTTPIVWESNDIVNYYVNFLSKHSCIQTHSCHLTVLTH